MTGRLNPVFAMAAAALVAAPFALRSSALEAQDRYRVLIPDSYAKDALDRGFGQKVADELRSLINQMPTHAPVDKKVINETLSKNGVKMQDLDCIKTRQLGSLVGGSKMAICIAYSSQGENRAVEGIEIWDLSEQESLKLDPFTVAKTDVKGAAQKIYQGFDRFIQQIAKLRLCNTAYSQQNWDDALTQCQAALALNPTSANTMRIIAIAHTSLAETATGAAQQTQYEAGLKAWQTLLAIPEQAYNEEALQSAGFLATKLQHNEEGRQYYQKYLDVNPGDVNVRRRIAYEMSAGDPEGAMQFIKVGLDHEATAELLTDYGNYAFAAATKAKGGATENTPQSETYYREAISALQRLRTMQGEQMDAGLLVNLAAAHALLKDYPAAITAVESFLPKIQDNVPALTLYAGALQAAGRNEDALAQWKKISTLQPDSASGYGRQAALLLQLGRVEEAIPVMKEAVARGGMTANEAATQVMGDGLRNGLNAQPTNLDYAIKMIEAAKAFEGIDANMKGQLDFWHGYALLTRLSTVYPRTDPPSLPSFQLATATRPQFVNLKRMLEGARGWAQSAGAQQVTNLNNVIKNVDSFIEISDLAIKKGPGQR